MPNLEQKKYDDFLHTARVVIARAVAEQEREAFGKSAGRRIATRIPVMALAAASYDLTLPTSEVSAQGGQLGIRFEPTGDKIKVTLQFKGFSAVSAGANRAGRLVSANRAIDSSIQFDGRGKAICVLLDVPEIREGLLAFDVEIVEPHA